MLTPRGCPNGCSQDWQDQRHARPQHHVRDEPREDRRLPVGVDHRRRRHRGRRVHRPGLRTCVGRHERRLAPAGSRAGAACDPIVRSRRPGHAPIGASDRGTVRPGDHRRHARLRDRHPHRQVPHAQPHPHLPGRPDHGQGPASAERDLGRMAEDQRPAVPRIRAAHPHAGTVRARGPVDRGTPPERQRRQPQGPAAHQHRHGLHERP